MPTRRTSEKARAGACGDAPTNKAILDDPPSLGAVGDADQVAIALAAITLLTRRKWLQGLYGICRRHRLATLAYMHV
jgi:hypothetical protein